MDVKVLSAVARELRDEHPALKESIFGALERLQRGENIPMPLCRPLFSVAKGLYELRFSDSAGELRVFYYVNIGDSIYVIHATRKKTQKLERRIIDLLQKRIRRLS